MNSLFGYLFFFFPSFIQVPLRRLMGQKIGKGSKICIGSIVQAKSLSMGEYSTIGPFAFVKAEKIEMGNHTSIKSLSAISTRIIKLGNYVHIAPLIIISSEFTEFSIIEICDHSRLFPFCWIDTGNGVFIGENVGVGGHTLIFTHGVWPNYLNGGPVSYGPVKIKNNVWLPWRVFILPNVTIEENTIVGANSLVNKSFPKNTLIGGNPAKILKENVHIELDESERTKRFETILIDFSNYINFKFKIKSSIVNGQLHFSDFKIVLDTMNNLQKGDMLFILNASFSSDEIQYLIKKGISVVNNRSQTVVLSGNNKILKNFISFVRGYGIRLYIN
jgi:acetyltransferase-like isoleucine patch superfamily enzyme